MARNAEAYISNPNSSLNTLSPAEINKVHELKTFIDGGISLMVSGKYADAIKYFRDHARARLEANNAGFSYDGQGQRVLLQGQIIPLVDNETQVDGFIQQLWNEFWFNPPAPFTVGTSPLIRTSAGIEVVGSGFLGVPTGGETKIIPEMQKLIDQNIALLNAEEWLHGFFYLLRQRPDFQPTALDDEVEIGRYLQEMGVNLTESFFNHYSQRTVLRATNPPPIP